MKQYQVRAVITRNGKETCEDYPPFEAGSDLEAIRSVRSLPAKGGRTTYTLIRLDESGETYIYSVERKK